MWPAVHHLLGYAWANLVNRLGTTTLSISIFSFIVPLAIFFVLMLIRWREQRKKGGSVKQIIRGSLLSWQTIVPSAIYALVWIGLITWSLATTTLKDHRALLDRIGQIKAEKKYSETVAQKTIDELTEKLKAKPQVVVRTKTVQAPSLQKNNSEELARLSAIRNNLANFLSSAETIKGWCLGAGEIPVGFSCQDQVMAWCQAVYNMLRKELEPQYAARFLAASGLALAYNKAKTDEINNAVNTLVFKENALNDFLKELSHRPND